MQPPWELFVFKLSRQIRICDRYWGGICSRLAIGCTNRLTSTRQGIHFSIVSPRWSFWTQRLPDGNGIEFCRWLQQQHQSLILMLSARSTETDIVEGLRAGADDYLTKPFGMQEFLARVDALTRRSKAPAPPASLDYGDLKIDLGASTCAV
jgi:DNA-binding NarL/FixJ family response regulator